MKAPQRRMVTNRKRNLENDENKPPTGQKDPVANKIKAIQKRDIPRILSIASGPEREECTPEHLSTVNDSESEPDEIVSDNEFEAILR